MSRAADGPSPAKKQCGNEGVNYSYSSCSLFDNEFFGTGQRDTDVPLLSPTLREAFVGALASTGLKRTPPTPPPPEKSKPKEDDWLQKEVEAYLLREQKNDEIRDKLRMLHASIEPTAKLPDHLRGTIIPPRGRIGEKRTASHFDSEDDDENEDEDDDENEDEDDDEDEDKDDDEDETENGDKKTDASDTGNAANNVEEENEDSSGHIGTDTRFCVIEGWQTLYGDNEFSEGYELVDDYFRLFRYTNGRFMYQRHMM